MPTACTLPEPHCSGCAPDGFRCVWASCRVRQSMQSAGRHWLSDHPLYVCGVWPVCLSLGLVRCASRVCWEPVAHRPPPPPPPCPQEWPSHSPLVPRGCDRMHRLYCAFLFLWLRRKQELDVLKSTCYPSKYCRGPRLPRSLAALLLTKICFLFNENKSRTAHPHPPPAFEASPFIVGSGLPGRGSRAPANCVARGLPSGLHGPRGQCSEQCGSQRCQRHVLSFSAFETPGLSVGGPRSRLGLGRVGCCHLLRGAQMCLDLCSSLTE